MTLLAVAHRAGNSMATLAEAVRLDADVVEADVHHHRGRLEVRHLKTMGPLPWLWDRWELVPASAPRLGLHELLVAAEHGATFMLDLKGRRTAVGREVARHLHRLAPGRPVVVCSRFWPSVDALGHLPWVRPVLSVRNRTELAALRRRLSVAAGARPHPAEVYGVSVHRSLLTPEVAGWLHRHVEVVMTWPVNDDDALAEAARYGATGVVGVISDVPDVLRQVVARR